MALESSHTICAETLLGQCVCKAGEKQSASSCALRPLVFQKQNEDFKPEILDSRAKKC